MFYKGQNAIVNLTEYEGIWGELKPFAAQGMIDIKMRVLPSKITATIVGVFAMVLLAVMLIVSYPAHAAVGINKMVSFQGKVVNSNGTNVADASYTFRFRVYTSSGADATNTCSANSCMWEESKSLTTVNGIFQTNLGDVTTLPGSVDFNSDTLYLGVLFNGDTEMTPRIRLTAVPYAFNADKLGGLASSAFVQLSPGSTQTGSIDVSSNIKSGGTFQGNAIDTAAANAITIGATQATAINMGKAGGTTITTLYGTAVFKTVGVNDSTTAFQFQNSGNYSILNVDTANARVGISTGATTPAYVLDVNGDTGITGNLHFASGTTRIVDVASNASGAGYNLTVRGGAAGSGNNNGGDLNLTGGAGAGTGALGLVRLSPAVFSASAGQTFGSPGTSTLGVALINANNAIPVNATVAGVTVNVPDPTQQIIGRILYITAQSGSQDFTLVLNSTRTSIPIAMRQNSTATLIWNGTDWTAAGASSSTTLQAAYDNTLASAGGAEILLNNTATSNGLTIRNGSVNPVIGGLFEVQSTIGTNFLSVNNGSDAAGNADEYAVNGGGETTPFTTSDWSVIGAGTVNRYTTLAANIATGQASIQVNTPATVSTGVKNKMSVNLTSGTQYQLSFTGKLASGTFTTLDVYYSIDGSAASTACITGQTLVTTGWSKITCTFTPGSSATGSTILIRQSDATARTFYIDNLSVSLSTATSKPPNVQIGGGIYGGTPTLFTLDRSSSPPVAAGNDVYYGSMYYDTTSGRIQCYQANGWGACGSAPDTFVNLTPEYAGAVLSGPGGATAGTIIPAGIGTMTADFCSNQTTILVTTNSALCGSGQALNFYKWTSPQPTQQTYSIYVSYQLPGGFKTFQSDTTVQLTARTDNTTNGIVTYEMFRSQGGALTACGTETTVTSTVNTWQTVGINGNEATGCSFTTASANNFAIFKINVKAKTNANVYVGALSFTVTNQ